MSINSCLEFFQPSGYESTVDVAISEPLRTTNPSEVCWPCAFAPRAALMKKLKLTYIPYSYGSCIPHPHWVLHTDEKNPRNIACVLLADKKDIKLLRKWVGNYNEENHETRR